MASFKYLIFIALAVYSVAADEGVRAKKHAYIAAVPAPVVGYSASAPGSFSYAYSDYSHYPVAAAAYHAPAAYPAATYPASTYPAATYPVTAYAAAAAYPSYHEDDGQYWPGKYEKTYVPAVAYKAAYPSYAEDDGQYWPGKYEKSYVPAYKAGYPVAYHY